MIGQNHAALPFPPLAALHLALTRRYSVPPTSPSAQCIFHLGTNASPAGQSPMKTWEGDEDANLEECKLLSGEFAALLQVLLGLIALSVLVGKRLRETPRRPLPVWGFDASKQMIGAAFAHVANLLIAILLYSYEDAHADSDQQVDQCAFYFVNFALDTSFGVFLNFIFLEAFSMLAKRFAWTSVMTPGDYGDPVRVRCVDQVVL